MIIPTASGPLELACDDCGCRHFDRINDCCYECGAAISEEAVADYRTALDQYLKAAGAMDQN